MTDQPLTDEQVFGKGFVYGPGATESGQPLTPQQQAYARSNATFVDRGAPAGTPQNPTYDTPTARGDNTIYHVGPDGRMYDPAADAAHAAGVAPAKGEMSDADIFGQDFAPGTVFDRRPVSQGVGAMEGASVVGKNLSHLLQPLLEPGKPVMDLFNVLSPNLKLANPYPDSLAGDYYGDRLKEAERTFRPGQLGKVGTEAALTLPLAAAGEGAPLIAGAMQGLLTSESDQPLDRLRDAAFGAAGGKVGDLVAGAGASTIFPKLRPEAQWAIDNNIRLTPGAIAGGPMAGVEGAAAKGTIAGPMVSGAQRQMIEDANLAAVNNALKPAGLALPADAKAGTAAIDKAHAMFGDAYDAITPKLTIAQDQPFNQRMSELAMLGSSLEPTLANRYDGLLKQVFGGFDANGSMAGTEMRKLDSALGKQQRRFAASDDPFHQEYADAISDLQETLRDAAERSNPTYASQLSALNSGYAQLVRLDKAAVLARQNGGVWTPDQLMQAVTSRGLDTSARQTSSARGTAMLQDWAQGAKDVLPNTMPNAGNIWTHLPELLVTAGVGHEAGLPAIGKVLLGEGALGAAYTKPAQSLIRTAMTERPAFAERVADVVRKTSPVFGTLGAVSAPQVVWPAISSMVRPALAVNPQ